MHTAVVDSSRVVRRLIADLVSERGDAVSEFADSASALRTIRTDLTIDTLITSLEVEPLSGLELCWEARLAIPPQRFLYIIVMSSLNNDRKLAESLDCGADDLIAKPVTRLELHAKLRMAGRLKSAQAHLVRLAEIDSMTGLYNRRAFFERLETELNRPLRKAPVSAVLFDIDHFKRINDTHGHDVGDLVIKRIAAEAAKRDLVVGRIGGEEFAMICDDPDGTKAVRIAEGLRRSCAALTFDHFGEPFSVTCSFGVSHSTLGDTPDTLLKKADIALYQAKAGGRNRVHAVEEIVTVDESFHPLIRRRPASIL
jgi:diguanylate cyclase (GGDEF)-like protein